MPPFYNSLIKNILVNNYWIGLRSTKTYIGDHHDEFDEINHVIIDQDDDYQSTWKWSSGEELTNAHSWEHWLRLPGSRVDSGYRGLMQVEPYEKHQKTSKGYTCASVHYSASSMKEWVESAKCDCKREVLCVKCKLCH